MSVNKKDIVQLLQGIAIYMEIKGENSFNVSAFKKQHKPWNYPQKLWKK